MATANMKDYVEKPKGFSNVVATIKSAVTGQGVSSTIKNPTANKIVSTLASNPFVTALGVTGAVYGAKAIGGAISGSTGVTTAKTVSQIGASTVGSSTFKTVATVGALGFGAGYLLSGSGSGGSATGSQTTNPAQTITPSQQISPNIKYDNRQTSYQYGYNYNYGSGSINSTAEQTPVLNTPTNIYPTQDLTTTQGTNPAQTTTGGSGSINPLLLVAVGLGAYLLLKRQ
jgi:hypothetical protein